MRPKFLRIRFLPIKDVAINAPQLWTGPVWSNPIRPVFATAGRTGPLRSPIVRGACGRNSPIRRRQKPGMGSKPHPGLQVSGRERGSRRQPAAGSGLGKPWQILSYFDSRPRLFKLLLDFCRLFLVDALLDRLGRGLDKILRFLEAKARNRPDFLDDVDLLVADRGQDDVELGLLGRRLRNRRRRRHAPFLFQHFRKLRRLDHRQGRQIFDQLCQIRHLAAPDPGFWVDYDPPTPAFAASSASACAATTRASRPAGACSTATRRAAGADSSPTSLPRNSSSEGRLASSLTPSASICRPASPPPTMVSFSLRLANSTTTLAAAIGSREKAIAVGPVNSGDSGSKRVPARARRASRFLVTRKRAPAPRICRRSCVTSATVRPD